MPEYRIVTVTLPPILRERDGKLYIVLLNEGEEWEAEVTQYFLRRVFEVAVLPVLKK